MRTTIPILFFPALLLLGGCANSSSRFTDHSATGLRQEGPSSSMPSLFQQDPSGSRSMQGGIGASQVIADSLGVSAASLLSQNTATLRIPDDSNGDGVIADSEITVLNVAGSSDFAVARMTYTGKNGQTITVEGLSSLNSPIGPSIQAIWASILQAYAAASADQRAEYLAWVEMNKAAIAAGGAAAEGVLKIGLGILTGGASAVVP